jgi:hypothetical protein
VAKLNINFLEDFCGITTFCPLKVTDISEENATSIVRVEINPIKKLAHGRKQAEL